MLNREEERNEMYGVGIDEDRRDVSGFAGSSLNGRINSNLDGSISCANDGVSLNDILSQGSSSIEPTNYYFQRGDKVYGSDGQVFIYDKDTDAYLPNCEDGSATIPSYVPSTNVQSWTDRDLSKTMAIKTSVERHVTESKKANEFQRGVVVGAAATVGIIALLMFLNHFGIYSIQNDPVIRLISKLLSNIF